MKNIVRSSRDAAILQSKAKFFSSPEDYRFQRRVRDFQEYWDENKFDFVRSALVKVLSIFSLMNHF
jgi:hypothetical protein